MKNEELRIKNEELRMKNDDAYSFLIIHYSLITA